MHRKIVHSISATRSLRRMRRAPALPLRQFLIVLAAASQLSGCTTEGCPAGLRSSGDECVVEKIDGATKSGSVEKTQDSEPSEQAASRRDAGEGAARDAAAQDAASAEGSPRSAPKQPDAGVAMQPQKQDVSKDTESVADAGPSSPSVPADAATTESNVPPTGQAAMDAANPAQEPPVMPASMPSMNPAAAPSRVAQLKDANATWMIYQPPDEHMEVLTVGGNGAVRVQWKGADQRWNSHVDLTAANIAPPGAPVAVVHQAVNEGLEAFFVGTDGAVYVIAKTKNNAWGEPRALTEPSFSPPGASIAAVYQSLNEQVEAFVVDREGALFCLYKAHNAEWGKPYMLSESGFASPGSQVAAAYYPTYQSLEVFLVDASGALNVVWKQNNGMWNKHFALTGADFARAGAPLSVTYQPRNEMLELFLFRSDGGLYALTKSQNSQWTPPRELVGAGAAPAGAHLASVYRPVGDQLSVLYTDQSGALRAVEQLEPERWNAPIEIAPGGTLPPGTRVAVAYYPINTQLEAVAAGTHDEAKLFFKPSGTTWMGPYLLQ